MQTIEKQQAQLDELSNTSEQLQRELDANPMKREAGENSFVPICHYYLLAVVIPTASIKQSIIFRTKCQCWFEEILSNINLSIPLAAALFDQITNLKARYGKAKEQAEKEANLSPEKIKEHVMQQIKADNVEISGMERKYVTKICS